MKIVINVNKKEIERFADKKLKTKREIAKVVEEMIAGDLNY